MTLGSDFHVLHATARLRDRKAVRAQTFEVKLDRLLDLALGLLDGIADSDASRKVRDVRRKIAFALFDQDRPAHESFYSLEIRTWSGSMTTNAPLSWAPSLATVSTTVSANCVRARVGNRRRTTPILVADTAWARNPKSLSSVTRM